MVQAAPKGCLLAALGRALCRLVIAVAAPATALALLVVNPLTRPEALAEAAVETGSHQELVVLGADFLVDRFGAESEESVDRESALSDSARQRLRLVLLDSFTSAWARDALTSLARSAESWIRGAQPPVRIDLTGPKERIRNHPDTPVVLAALGEEENRAERRDWAEADQALGVDPAVEAFLADLPDEVTWEGAEWWETLTARAGQVREASGTVALAGAAATVLALGIGIALSGPPLMVATSRWVARVALAVAIPLIGVSWLLPAVAAALPLPQPLSIVARTLGGALGPARLVGFVAIGVSFLTWAASHLLSGLREEKAAALRETTEVPAAA